MLLECLLNIFSVYNGNNGCIKCDDMQDNAACNQAGEVSFDFDAGQVSKIACMLLIEWQAWSGSLWYHSYDQCTKEVEFTFFSISFGNRDFNPLTTQCRYATLATLLFKNPQIEPSYLV